ncbi:MAG: YigZ family protein [Clostridia bacterium]|nr:YigZ family protein [Clostridia bacterium]
MIPYRTIVQPSEAEFVEKRSRFIGRCIAVESEGDAQERLAELRKRHWDASHNCYAYIVGARGETARYSDDGEPQGTAGLPILDVLKAKGLTNALCVVTRYFGGVLLGAGGLVRAYSRAAAMAVEAAGIVEYIDAVVLQIVVDYSRYGQIEGFVRQSAQLEGVEFTDAVTITVSIEADRADAFCAELTERTDGRVSAQRLREGYLCRAVSQ